MGPPLRVSLEVTGLSQDGMFFRIEHNVYNDKGENLATCELLGAWINLKSRQLTALPSEFLDEMDAFPKSKDFKVLTKEDTRKFGKKPINLS